MFLPQGVLTLCTIFIPNFFSDVYWPLGDLLDISTMSVVTVRVGSSKNVSDFPCFDWLQ